jgi:3-hydroxyisobutyrate dehydrogenase-like beta-hydroxyacid dehydrogenase
MKPRISVLGAGLMGSALVKAFLKQEYRVDIWNRTKSKCEPLAALGARIATTAEDAVTAADIVVVNVNDYVTSNRLLQSDGVVKGLRGKLLVQLTSGSPRQAREMAVCEAEGLRLDAYTDYLKPVMAQVDGWVIDTVKRIEERRFASDEETLATLDSHYGAFRHLLELSKEHGIHHAALDAFEQIFKAAIRAGHAQDDFAILNKFMR